MLNTSPMQRHFARICLNASGLRDFAILRFRALALFVAELLSHSINCQYTGAGIAHIDVWSDKPQECLPLAARQTGLFDWLQAHTAMDREPPAQATNQGWAAVPETR